MPGFYIPHIFCTELIRTPSYLSFVLSLSNLSASCRHSTEVLQPQHIHRQIWHLLQILLFLCHHPMVFYLCALIKFGIRTVPCFLRIALQQFNTSDIHCNFCCFQKGRFLHYVTDFFFIQNDIFSLIALGKLYCSIYTGAADGSLYAVYVHVSGNLMEHRGQTESYHPTPRYHLEHVRTPVYFEVNLHPVLSSSAQSRRAICCQHTCIAHEQCQFKNSSVEVEFAVLGRIVFLNVHVQFSGRSLSFNFY